MHFLVYPAYPMLGPDTKDFYSVPVGTPFTSLDCGVPLGELSMMYSVEWSRGLTSLPQNGNERFEVALSNFSLGIRDAQLSDGAVYQCTVTVEQVSVYQRIAILAHRKHSLFV